MEIKTINKGDATIIKIDDRLDGTSSPELQKYLNEITKQDLKLIVLDMEFLNFISSVGFRVIVSSAKAVQAKKGKFVLSGINGAVEKAFKMAALDRIFKIYDNVDNALTMEA